MDNHFKNSLVCRSIWRICGFGICVSLLVVFFALAMKQPRKNWEIEKSVMKPDNIEANREAFSFNAKRYPDDSDDASLFQTFETAMRKYGIALKTQEFEIREKKGWNTHATIASRKEGMHRCFILTFDRRNAHSLLTAELFVDQFFTRNSNLGLGLVLLGFDGRFAQFNEAVQQFFQFYFSDAQSVVPCSHPRDGLSLKISLTSDPSHRINYFPCKLNRRK